MPALQELILSACSSEASSSSSSAARISSAPAIHLHDIQSFAPVHSFKTSVSAGHALGYTPTQDGRGGAIFAVQDGKSILHCFAWQKDQMHLKMHLAERLSCFEISPNGLWAAGGSPTGHIYLWEISSGILHASFPAHYRGITSLTFTSDSRLLLSASLDASLHIFLISRLANLQENIHAVPKPYGTLNDHTLEVRAVAVGRTTSVAGGRCWTAAKDGTVKMWSLHPPFDLLATFSLPIGTSPNSLVLDPSERFVYAGSDNGHLFRIPLYRHTADDPNNRHFIEAVGGGGPGSAPIKLEGSVVSYPSAITALALSLTASHLLVGTQAAEIHVHALPSHQHIRTLSSHGGPITHLSTILRPADLVGGPQAGEYPIMDIRTFERTKTASRVKTAHETGVVLTARSREDLLDRLRAARPRKTVASSAGGSNEAEKIAELEAENLKLRAHLDRAIRMNDQMWNGIVDMKLAQAQPNGDA